MELKDSTRVLLLLDNFSQNKFNFFRITISYFHVVSEFLDRSLLSIFQIVTAVLATINALLSY